MVGRHATARTNHELSIAALIRANSWRESPWVADLSPAAVVSVIQLKQPGRAFTEPDPSVTRADMVTSRALESFSANDNGS
jgi:hypothetical protein